MSLPWIHGHLYDQIWNWRWSCHEVDVHQSKESQIKVELSVISYIKGELLFYV